MQRFKIGDTVRITRGPYSSFVGVVEKVSPTKLALVVSVNMFGRRIQVAVGSRTVEQLPPEDYPKRPSINRN